MMKMIRLFSEWVVHNRVSDGAHTFYSHALKITWPQVYMMNYCTPSLIENMHKMAYSKETAMCS